MSELKYKFEKDLMYLADLCDFVVQDDLNPYFKDFARYQFEKLVHDKIIMVSNQKMFWCKCGCVEINKTALNVLIKQKNNKACLLYHNESNISFCKICQSELQSGNEDILLLNLPIVPPNNIYPLQMHGQFKQAFEQVKANKIRIISRRHRNTGNMLLVNGWMLEPEFWWLPYLAWIVDKEKEVVLVSGLNTITKAIRIISMTKLIKPELKIDLFVHPLIRLKDQGSIISKMTTVDFVDAYKNSNILRAFLSLGLSWSADRIVLNSSELHLSFQTINNISTNSGFEKDFQPMQLNLFSAMVNRNNLLKLFKKIRSKKQLEKGEETLVKLIIQ